MNRNLIEHGYQVNHLFEFHYPQTNEIIHEGTSSFWLVLPRFKFLNLLLKGRTSFLNTSTSANKIIWEKRYFLDLPKICLNRNWAKKSHESISPLLVLRTFSKPVIPDSAGINSWIGLSTSLLLVCLLILVKLLFGFSAEDYWVRAWMISSSSLSRPEASLAYTVGLMGSGIFSSTLGLKISRITAALRIGFRSNSLVQGSILKPDLKSRNFHAGRWKCWVPDFSRNKLIRISSTFRGKLQLFTFSPPSK